MTMGDAILLLLAACLFGFGYYLGRSRGYSAAEEAKDGWQDEALWWRRNATGIEKREGSDAPD